MMTEKPMSIEQAINLLSEKMGAHTLAISLLAENIAQLSEIFLEANAPNAPRNSFRDLMISGLKSAQDLDSSLKERHEELQMIISGLEKKSLATASSLKLVWSKDPDQS